MADYKNSTSRRTQQAEETKRRDKPKKNKNILLCFN
jgi:hypothetical protein